MISLRDAPAVVAPSRVIRRLEVHLFPQVLPDIRDEQISARAVEVEFPRVAQSVGPDLRQGARLADKRIAGRHGETGSRIDVDAQQLAQANAEVLCVVVGITAAAAVADADVQIAVRAEDDVAAVVIAERVCHREELAFRRRVRHIGVRRAAQVFRDDDRTVGLARVVDVELAAGPELRMERKAEKPALAARQHLRRDIEERSREHGAVPDDLDHPALLDHEKPAAAVARMRDLDGQRQAACDEPQGHGRWSAERLPAKHENQRNPNPAHGRSTCQCWSTTVLVKPSVGLIVVPSIGQR